MGTITVTLITSTTVGSVGPQNLTKTYTDTDANLVLALQAVQWQFSAVSLAAGALTWFNGIIRALVQQTTAYQQATNPTTTINPT